MANATDNSKAKLGIRARQDAIRWLREKYADEFNKKVEDNRIALGLARRPNTKPVEQIEAELERQKERLKKKEEELKLARAEARRVKA